MPPKTEAQKKRMVASAAMKKYKDFSAIQLSRELKRLQGLEKKQTTPANVIRIAVVKKLISKVDDKEISATEARQELKKKVPEKKQVTKKEFEKARKDLKDKKVSKPEKKTDPNSTGQKNLQALLRLRDLSDKISEEVENTKMMKKEDLEKFNLTQLSSALKKAYKEKTGKDLKFKPPADMKAPMKKRLHIRYILERKINVRPYLEKEAEKFKMTARERRDLIFQWKLWWERNMPAGLGDYKIMPVRVANNAFKSREEIEDKEKREEIFMKLEELIGDGSTSDGDTWRTITAKDVKEWVSNH